MVAGEGPQPALAMIVGEAPGFEEEKLGRPFVGRSGQLLDTALRAVGFSRDDIYITNVMKEVPLTEDGKIRRPTEEEVLEWSGILRGEIETTAPACILALGRTAVQALTDIDGSKVGHVWTAYHPAYILRQRRKMDEWVTEQILPWAQAVDLAAFNG
jgi:DNA polymerase